MRVTLYRRAWVGLDKALAYAHGMEWRWTITAANGITVGSSTEGYSRRIDAVRNLEAITGRWLDHSNLTGDYSLFNMDGAAWPVTVKP